MEHNPGTSIIVTDGYWMHIRHTRIHHRQYPEVRGEGASPAAAAAHLAKQLAGALDFCRGREAFEALVRALADVHAFRWERTVRRTSHGVSESNPARSRNNDLQ
jgi:hypothetical protein